MSAEMEGEITVMSLRAPEPSVHVMLIVIIRYDLEVASWGRKYIKTVRCSKRTTVVKQIRDYMFLTSIKREEMVLTCFVG